jgi:UDP-N-acetylmuramyl tripeptide synthase
MKLITIIFCKLLSCIGRLIGKGSSLPGKIALKLCPDILSRLTLPKDIIAITGSNGKTSTVEMVAGILKAAGKQVVYNKEGSNQIEGVTTMLLNHATLRGKVRGDLVLLESDERYARHTFRHIKPTMFAITNLYRDQLTRNAHPFYIYNIIKEAVDQIPNARLVVRMWEDLKTALSSRISVVFSVTPEFSPPMIPASAIGF